MKFIDTDKSKLFVTGCTHLNHNTTWDNPLHKQRGYESAKDMTDGIIEIINSMCTKDDKLLVLGDFCLTTTWDEFQELIWRINPHLLFIRGNHNNPWEKQYRNFCKEEYGHIAVEFTNWLGKIDYYGDYLELVWNKKRFVCNHYAYTVWNASHHGSMSLCSHSHGTLPEILPEYKLGKQLDCGWDVHGKPLTFEEIMSIMRTKEIKQVDHHDRNTN